MLRVQYFLPEGYPTVNVPYDEAIMKMCAKLKGVDTQGAAVPNSALSVKLLIVLNGATLEVRKRGQLVYVNFFCFEPEYLDGMFVLVEAIYRERNLGTPKHPKIATWIHSIPMAHELLRDNEVLLCQKVTVSLFWAVNVQRMKKSGKLN